MNFTMTQRRLFVIGQAGLMMALAWTLTGCGGEPEATPPPAGGSNAAPDVSQYAPAPAPQVQPQKLELPPDANSDAVLSELNYQLKRWIVRNQRVPANFEEFVSSAQIQVPPPPPGKKYVMGKQVKIELVNR